MGTIRTATARYLRLEVGEIEIELKVGTGQSIGAGVSTIQELSVMVVWKSGGDSFGH